METPDDTKNQVEPEEQTRSATDFGRPRPSLTPFHTKRQDLPFDARVRIGDVDERGRPASPGITSIRPLGYTQRHEVVAEPLRLQLAPDERAEIGQRSRDCVGEGEEHIRVKDDM